MRGQKTGAATDLGATLNGRRQNVLGNQCSQMIGHGLLDLGMIVIQSCCTIERRDDLLFPAALRFLLDLRLLLAMGGDFYGHLTNFNELAN